MIRASSAPNWSNFDSFVQNFDVNHEITSRFPVHYAADYGQADVLAYLLSKGANANVSTHGTSL